MSDATIRTRPGTGPLIKILLEIAYDVRHFFAIAVVLLFGFTIAFSVSMPNSQQFGFQGVVGPMQGCAVPHPTTRNWPFSVLGFWVKNTGVCPGAMPYRRDFTATTRI